MRAPFLAVFLMLPALASCNSDPKPDATAAPREAGSAALIAEQGATPPASAPDVGGQGPAPTAALSTCTITWPKGARIEVTTFADTTQTRVDLDNNDSPDACSTHTHGDTITIDVDDGCDGSVEQTLVLTKDPAMNVAHGSLKDSQGGTTSVSLLLLNGPAGALPGIALLAEKTAITWSVKDRLVRRATVKRPTQGAPLTLRASYDKAGRLIELREDLARDSTDDRIYRYTYRDDGTLTTLSVTTLDGNTTKASLEGRCMGDVAPARVSP